MAVAVAFGMLGGLGAFTFGYGEGYAYLGNNPATCANCHVMQDSYDSWQKSSHHAVAVCNDCHTPHDRLLGKYLTKADNGFFHSLAFTTGDFKDPIARKQEARAPFVRVVDLNEISVDPEPWGRDWPHHFDGWKSTAGDKFYGGSNAMPQSKLESQPWLKRLYAGYAFSIDYREARGHAYMLYDQGVTERVSRKIGWRKCCGCGAKRCGGWTTSAAKTRAASTPTRKRLASSANRSTPAARLKRWPCVFAPRRPPGIQRMPKEPVRGVTPEITPR